MTLKEAINQLESLREDAFLRIEDPEDEDDEFKKDAEAINMAIGALKKALI